MTKRILLVDDEEDICEALKEELEDEGFEAEYVTTGENALAKIETGVWDMAIVDIKLSTKVTGLQVLEAISQKCPNTILVAFSGYEDIAIRQRVMRLGAKAFFRKPADIQLDVFRKKIKALFEVHD